jgi:hypothetical protein
VNSRRNAVCDLPIADVRRHHRTCTYDGIATHAFTRKHGCSEANERAVADLGPASRGAIRGYVRVTADLNIMLDHRSCVDDSPSGNPTPGIQHGARHNHDSFADVRGRRDYGRRVYRRNQTRSRVSDALCDSFSRMIVANTQSDFTVSARSKPLVRPTHRKSEDRCRACSGIVEEALQLPPAGPHNLGNYSSVTAGSEYENRRRIHRGRAPAILATTSANCCAC